MAERQMVIVLALNVQLFRCREAPLVGIRGDDSDHHERAARDSHTSHLHVFARVALGSNIDRRGQAKQLLDSRANRLQVSPESGKLVRMLQQQQGPSTNQVDRGFVPGDQKDRYHGQQLVWIQAVGSFSKVGQPADEVLAGARTALSDQAEGITNWGRSGSERIVVDRLAVE
jgi:hypothetical protein